MTTEIIMALSNVRNMPNIADRLHCYEQAFSVNDDVLLSNPKMVCSDWVIQFTKDVFEQLESREQAELWCFNQFRRLFIDLDFELNLKKNKAAAAILDKLAQWLLKEGVQHMKKWLQPKQSEAKPEISVKALKAWGIAIKLLGLHTLQATEKTNTCLSVFPAAFKCPNMLVVKEAFRSWKMLLKVFTLDPNWQSTANVAQDKNVKITSRLELIIKALKYPMDKNMPEVAPEVFDCWWFCCISLGARLALNYENVAHGLLRYCVGGTTDYKSTNENIEQIVRAVDCPLGANLVSLMNPKLDNKNSYAKCAENPALWARLPDLLASLIHNNAEASSCPFDNADVLKDNALFALQCVRFCEQKCGRSIDDLKELIPDLFIAMLEKIVDINNLLSSTERAVQLVLFLAQFTAWIHESTLSAETLSVCIIRFEKHGVFEQIAAADPHGVYSKFSSEYKSRLDEAKKRMPLFAEDEGTTPQPSEEVENEAEAPVEAMEVEDAAAHQEDHEKTAETQATGTTLTPGIATALDDWSFSSISEGNTLTAGQMETSSTNTAIGIAQGEVIAQVEEQPEELTQQFGQEMREAPVEKVDTPQQQAAVIGKPTLEVEPLPPQQQPTAEELVTSAPNDEDASEKPLAVAEEENPEDEQPQQVPVQPVDSQSDEHQLTIVEEEEDDQAEEQEGKKEEEMKEAAPMEEANGVPTPKKIVQMDNGLVAAAKKFTVSPVTDDGSKVLLERVEEAEEQSKVKLNSEKPAEEEAAMELDEDRTQEESAVNNTANSALFNFDDLECTAQSGNGLGVEEAARLNASACTSAPPQSPPVAPSPMKVPPTPITPKSGILRKMDSPAAKKTHRVKFNVSTGSNNNKGGSPPSPPLKTPTKALDSPYPKQKRALDDTDETGSSSTSTPSRIATFVNGPSPAKRNAFVRDWPIGGSAQRQHTRPTIIAPHRMGGSARARRAMHPAASTVPISPAKTPLFSTSSMPSTQQHNLSLPALYAPTIGPAPATPSKSKKASLVIAEPEQPAAVNTTTTTTSTTTTAAAVDEHHGHDAVNHQQPAVGQLQLDTTVGQMQLDAVERAMDAVLEQAKQAFNQHMADVKRDLMETVKTALMGAAQNGGGKS